MRLVEQTGFPPQNPGRAILLKVCAVTSFVLMATLIKATGKGVPAGEIVFFRSLFAIFPILIYLAFRGQLKTALRTSNIMGHLGRGLVGVIAMGLGFYGLTQLPLPEVIALGYALPLMVVVFSALILKEDVRLYRWGAVIVGLIGVLIISWPRLTLVAGEAGLSDGQTAGVIAVLLSAVVAAMAAIIVRSLVEHEAAPTIVLYFSLTATGASLLTIPFGWATPSTTQTGLLIGSGIFGGIGQILVTQSYRYADTSTVAPFEYVSILLGIGIGYFVFSDIPSSQTLAGSAVVIAAGVFIIYREHRLGLERRRSRRVLTPQG